MTGLSGGRRRGRRADAGADIAPAARDLQPRPRVNTFRCGRCAGVVATGAARPGQPIACPRCGHVSICPMPRDTTAASPIESRRPRFSWRRIAATILVVAAAAAAWVRFGRGVDEASAHPKTPGDTLQQELLEQNLGKPGDPELEAIYRALSTRHFGGALPPMPVLWEPRLAQVGLLASRSFTLEGMFGHEGSRSVILLNPDIQRDPGALARALSHEMVHAYLYGTGDRTTDHGPAFQTVLQRLSAEGAFEGIRSSPEERTSLRQWIDAESARLDKMRLELDALGTSVEAERGILEHAIADANARGGLPAADAAALNARREAYNQMALDANLRSERARADRDHFTREVARYNLMLVYPDGVDRPGS